MTVSDMLNSHKFSGKNCKILKTKLVRSIFIYLAYREISKKKKKVIQHIKKIVFFFCFFVRQKLVSLTKNWGDFICSLVFMLAYCVQRKFPDWQVARLVY